MIQIACSSCRYNFWVLFCGTSVGFHLGTIDLHRKKTRQWWTEGIMDTNRGSFFPDSTIKPVSTQDMERERSWRPCSSASFLISLLWLGELHLLSLSSSSSCQLSPAQNSSVTAIKQMLRCTRPLRTIPRKLIEVSVCVLDAYFPISRITVLWWRRERHGLFIRFYLSLLVLLVCAGICLPEACSTAYVRGLALVSLLLNAPDTPDGNASHCHGFRETTAMLMVWVNGRSLERQFLYFEVAVERGCFLEHFLSNLRSSIFCKKKCILIYFTYGFLLIMILSFLLVIHFNQYFACTLYWLFLSIFSNRWIYDISGESSM